MDQLSSLRLFPVKPLPRPSKTDTDGGEEPNIEPLSSDDQSDDSNVAQEATKTLAAPELRVIVPEQRLDPRNRFDRRQTSGPSGDSTEILRRNIKGKTVTSAELAKTFADVRNGLVFVNWFTADLSENVLVLHMIVLRVSPENCVPAVFRIQPGTGSKIKKWVQLQLTPGSKNLAIPSAYNDLQPLGALVSPLASLTEPGDTLVFCLTTAWDVHCVPLHALEISARSSRASTQSTAPPSIESSSGDKNILALRNRIVYTYSHSLMQISMEMRRHRLGTGSTGRNWRASVISPLSQLPPKPHVNPLQGDFRPIVHKKKASTT